MKRLEEGGSDRGSGLPDRPKREKDNCSRGASPLAASTCAEQWGNEPLHQRGEPAKEENVIFN